MRFREMFKLSRKGEEVLIDPQTHCQIQVKSDQTIPINASRMIKKYGNRLFNHHNQALIHQDMNKTHENKIPDWNSRLTGLFIVKNTRFS